MNLAVRADTLEAAAAAPRLAAGIVDLAGLRGRETAWDALLDAALYPNPFHGRAVLSAHGGGLLPGRLRFVAVGAGAGLEALLPFVPNGALIGWRRANRVWTPPHFSVNGTPLIGGARPEESAGALLDGMAEAGGLWRFPLVSVDSPAGRALLAACERRGFATAVLSSFGRAVLRRRGGYEAYVREHLGAGRRKGLARRWRRLGKAGRVEIASFEAGTGLRDAVEAFLTLEARGWKGRRGTALASRAPSAALARTLFTASGAVRGRADALTLDGRPIAVSLALVCAGTAFLLKTAHDEALRELAPGVLLEDAILRAFLDRGFAEKLDSASLPGCLLEDLYADRERIADLAVATDPALSGAALEALAVQERRREAALAVLKGWYWRAMPAARRLSEPAV